MPGSSGRICSLLAASSRTSSSWRPASRSRHSPVRASRSAGICPAGTPMVSSRLASASAGSTGWWPRVCACSGKKICPPGNRLASRCAACDGERGLADAGHPADRVDAHHPARARRRLGQLGQLVLASGERGDVAGQRPGRRRAPPAAGPARRRTAPRGSLELDAGPAAQPQRVGEQPYRVLARGSGQAPLQVADRPRVQPRRLGQLLLGQRGPSTQPPQHTGEPNRRLSHSLSSCPRDAQSTASISRRPAGRLRAAPAQPRVRRPSPGTPGRA